MLNAARKGGHNRQDRAFPRSGQRIVRVLAAGPDGLRKRVRRKTRNLTSGVTHSLEELRHDRTGISPGSVEQRVGNGCQQSAEMALTVTAQYAKCGAEGKTQVCSCVAVCDRKYINAIQEILLSENPVNSGGQGSRKAVAIDDVVRCQQYARYSRGSRKVTP